MYFLLLCLLMSAAASALVLILLRNIKLLDKPGERNNHTRPTPVGGGIGFVPIIILGLWAAPGYVGGDSFYAPGFLLSTTLLLITGFADDVLRLPVRVRLAAQIAAIIFAYQSLSNISLFNLHPYISSALLALSLIWFINLFNFMDGADGLATIESISIAIGIAGLATLLKSPDLSLCALVVAVCMIGFLPFNWSPARIFMGDAGSISLGFILGVLLLELARRGAIVPALILPAYFVLDASLTLIKRLKRRERIWQAHSTHAYQIAVRSGFTHREVASMVLLLNITLIALAVAAYKYPGFELAFLAFGYLTAWLLITRFQRQ